MSRVLFCILVSGFVFLSGLDSAAVDGACNSLEQLSQLVEQPPPLDYLSRIVVKLHRFDPGIHHGSIWDRWSVQVSIEGIVLGTCDLGLVGSGPVPINEQYEISGQALIEKLKEKKLYPSIFEKGRLLLSVNIQKRRVGASPKTVAGLSVAISKEKLTGKNSVLEWGYLKDMSKRTNRTEYSNRSLRIVTRDNPEPDPVIAFTAYYEAKK